jgi:N-acetylmuramoyl-L-alanine amidase
MGHQQYQLDHSTRISKGIKNVYYEQKEDDVFRITIELKHAQHWGHQLYYAGNSLVIKIKQQPENLSLKNLTIAVDAVMVGPIRGLWVQRSYRKRIDFSAFIKIAKAAEKEGPG